QATKELRHDHHRELVMVMAVHPSRLLAHTRTAGAHDSVHVREEQKLARPREQYHRDRGYRTQALVVVCERVLCQPVIDGHAASRWYGIS
ncbi:MAG: hypothetical protein RL701_3153, partial [Pseudomonadota bacterium]